MQTYNATVKSLSNSITSSSPAAVLPYHCTLHSIIIYHIQFQTYNMQTRPSQKFQNL